MNLEQMLSADSPYSLFANWFQEAKSHSGIKEPTAMTLATVNRSGQPHARTVLLKTMKTDQGFVFFTNYESRKGQDLTSNPHAALLFYWDPMFRQIKIDGRCEKIPRQESVEYWNSRPWQSRLAGWVSQQSRAVTGSLAEEYQKAEKKWKDQEIPCPEHWGGYLLRPQEIEFWLGHQYRLHDRVRFSLDGGRWRAQQLYP